MVELSPRAHLEDDVDVGGIVEEAVHFDDVGVGKVSLDLQFSDKLFNDLLFYQ